MVETGQSYTDAMGNKVRIVAQLQNESRPLFIGVIDATCTVNFYFPDGSPELDSELFAQMFKLQPLE